jgi:hypothetical protein
VQVSTSFSDLQEFGSKIIGPHIATERPSAPVRPYAPGMRKNPFCFAAPSVSAPGSCRRSDAFGAWAPVPVRGLGPSGTCRFRLCVRGMRWPLPFLRPFPPRSPPPACRPALFEASSVLCSRPTPHTFPGSVVHRTSCRGPGSPWRLRAVSQVPTRSLTARTGLRRSDGPSPDGPAHVACGGLQRLGLHGKKLSKLNTVLVVSLCTLRDHRHR